VNGVTYTLIYDAENRLYMINETGTNPEVVTGEYVYDGDGNRIKTIVDGKTTYYIGNYYEKIVEGNNTTIKKYYYSGGVRVAMSEKINEGMDNIRYFVTDHLGSTTKLINTDDSEYSEMDYLAWGSDKLTPPDIGASFKYTGQRQAEAGLYFYNARWYDPQIGRFIQADTKIPEPGNPLAWDRYAYGYNNSIKITDPSGHKPCESSDASGKCVAEPGAQKVFNNIKRYDGSKAATWAYENWDKYDPMCQGFSCTEFVSTALHEGGLPYTERWEKYTDIEQCKTVAQPWASTSALYDYLTNDLGYKAIEVDLNNLAEFYNNNKIPPGSVVFYGTKFVDPNFSEKNSFVHAAITTNNQATFNGITGPEVANHNGSIAAPHLLSQTQNSVDRIVVVIIGF
jgi:RHS repeat-associated protein